MGYADLSEIVDAQAQPLDIHRAAGFGVGFHDHGVEPGIAGRGLEFRRQGGEKPAERRRDVEVEPIEQDVGRPQPRPRR